MRIYSGFIKLKPAQVAYFNSLSATDHFLSLILVGLNAYAVYSLYRMRAISLVLFVFALGTVSNFGILSRQRSQVMPFVFVLLCVPPLVGRQGTQRAEATPKPARRGSTLPRRSRNVQAPR